MKWIVFSGYAATALFMVAASIWAHEWALVVLTAPLIPLALHKGLRMAGAWRGSQPYDGEGE